MSEAFTGEIRIFAGQRIPEGWMACNGQLVSINDYQVLYSLIGTTYGGDGSATFGLPNLQGRLIAGTGRGTGSTTYTQGQTFGANQVTLATSDTSHTHSLVATNTNANVPSPSNAFYGAVEGGFVAYATNGATGVNVIPFDPRLLASAGGNQPHDNMMPSLALNYIICVNGIYPTFD